MNPTGNAALRGVTASPGYLLGRLSHILSAPVDKRKSLAEEEERRREKSGLVTSAFNAILENRVVVGVRDAVRGVPDYFTTEVATGGFATGRLMAELRAGEKKNEEFLSSGPDAVRLMEALETGCFRIRVPEHALIPVVFLLLKKGETEEAEKILRTVSPFMHRLRFYPDIVDTPFDPVSAASVRTVGDVMKSLQESIKALTSPDVPRARQFLAQANSAERWLPLKSELLALFAETVACSHPPLLLSDGDGASKKAQFETYPDCMLHADGSCGWPCQHQPEGWLARAEDLLRRCNEAVETDTIGKQGVKRKGAFAELMECLQVCVNGRGFSGLTGRQVGLIRQILGGTNAQHGLPGSAAFETFKQHLIACAPQNIGRSEQTAVHRLQTFPAEDGLSVEQVEEFVREGASSSVCKKVRRCRRGPIEDLIAERLVGSAEVLGRLIPSLAAEAIGTGIEDLALRRVLFGLYRAFASRRSLLLLNYQNQVRLRDLPWAVPLLNQSGGDAETDAAMGALVTVAHGSISGFPQTIIPNKLLKSLRDLSDAVGFSDEHLPLTDELAADIFMGGFTKKFAVAGKHAATLLKGKLYERYYGLETVYERAREGGWGPNQLGEAVRERAGANDGRWTVASNGKQIEQQQVICTHNLASLYAVFDLQVQADGVKLGMDVWGWILKRLVQVPGGWKERLRICKDIAYAWRQLVFFFSTVDERELEGVVGQMAQEAQMKCKGTRLEGKQSEINRLFLAPLDAAVKKGGQGEGGEQREVKPLLGWVEGRHPLMDLF